MITRMIDNQYSFPEKSLSISMRNGFIQLITGFMEEIDKSLAVRDDLIDGFFEIGFMGRFLFLWPVVSGPVHAFVIGVAAKIKDIPLRDPNMLYQLPQTIRQSMWDLS